MSWPESRTRWYFLHILPAHGNPPGARGRLSVVLRVSSYGIHWSIPERLNLGIIAITSHEDHLLPITLTYLGKHL